MKHLAYSFLIFLTLFSCTPKKEETKNVSDVNDTALTTINFNKEIINFGNVKKGEILNAEYTFKNLGNNDLIIDYVNPECGCTSYNLSQDRVIPSDSGSINLLIDTKDKLGEISIYAVVKSNTKNKFNRLLVKANVQ